MITILRERPKPSSEQSVTSLTRELLRVTLSGLTGILGSKRGKTMLQYKWQQKHRKHAEIALWRKKSPPLHLTVCKSLRNSLNKHSCSWEIADWCRMCRKKERAEQKYELKTLPVLLFVSVFKRQASFYRFLSYKQ